MAKQTDPHFDLKHAVQVAVRECRRSDAKLYVAMARYYDATQDMDFLIHVTQRSRRTVYHFLAVGWGLINKKITAKQVEVHGYTKIIATQHIWATGDKSWSKQAKAFTVASIAAREPVTSFVFHVPVHMQDRVTEALLMYGAERKGTKMLGRDAAFLQLVEVGIALSEDNEGKT